jgi:hypothetical protein
MKMTFPQLRELFLISCEGFLDAARLDALEGLTLFGEEQIPYKALSPSSLPIHLTELVLYRMSLTLVGTSHCLPRLKKLELCDTHIHGVLRHLPQFPKLKTLILDDICFHPENSPTTELILDEAAQMLSDALFFRGIPEIECLSLISVEISGDLIVSLRSCPMLRSLSLESCYIEPLLLFFADDRPYTSYLPTLKEFSISESWPYSIGMTYTDFITRLSSLMPGVQICGDDKQSPY